MGRRVAALLAGVGVAAALTLAGCSTAPGPTAAQIDSTTLAPTVPQGPNDASTTGACSLLTAEQIAEATAKDVTRTSNVGSGCAWSSDTGGSAELVVSLRVNASDESGDGARAFADALAAQQSAGPVVQVPGLGERAFASDVRAPTVWWLQGQHVYSLSIGLAPADGVGINAAVQLAQIASGNITS